MIESNPVCCRYALAKLFNNCAVIYALIIGKTPRRMDININAKNITKINIIVFGRAYAESSVCTFFAGVAICDILHHAVKNSITGQTDIVAVNVFVIEIGLAVGAFGKIFGMSFAVKFIPVNLCVIGVYAGQGGAETQYGVPEFLNGDFLIVITDTAFALLKGGS